jgi:hypothetical protein
MEQSFTNAPREHQLRSEYAFKMNELYKAVLGIQEYCAKLDGTARQLDKKLIEEIQDFDNIFQEQSNDGWNWHELQQVLHDHNQQTQGLAIRHGFNSYVNEFHLLQDIMNYMMNEGFSFDLEWEEPQFTIKVEISSRYDIIIQNNSDINIELYMNDKDRGTNTLLLETRNTQLIINQLEFNFRLFN